VRFQTVMAGEMPLAAAVVTSVTPDDESIMFLHLLRLLSTSN
jgi:hypothetical protein